jgi:cobalt/nickel transport protein
LTKKGYVALVLAGLGIALLITLFSPLASSSPDGLERVAEDNAFIDKGEKEPPYKLIADYAFPWVDNEDAATILAGIVGVLVVGAFVFVLGVGLGALSRRAAVAGTRPAGPAPPASAAGKAGHGEQ